MAVFKKLLLMLTLLLTVTLCDGKSIVNSNEDGAPITIIRTSNYGGDDKSSSIIASINGHYLSVTFTENLGQVSIRIFNENGAPIDLITTPTPNGQIIYVTLVGSYTILFTLPNGDEYWGEFDVTD